MENFQDLDIIQATTWIKSHVHEDHWPTRIQEIEDKVTQLTHAVRDGDFTKEMQRLNLLEDPIGWYLYLMQCLTCDIDKYEFYQGARVAPIFKTLGAHFDLVKKIGGISTKVLKMIKSEKKQTDSILFEILIALLWVREGYEVSFITEGNERSPDLMAIKGEEKWFIECKRLSQRSEYSFKEQNNWLAMLKHISKYLTDHNLFLKVVFHKELHSIQDTYIRDLLIEQTLKNGEILEISNEILTLSTSKINLAAINKILEKEPVKNGSPYLRELIGGDRESTGFSAGILAKYGTYGKPAGFNKYLLKISNIFAVDWNSDAPQAIETKARDIMTHLKKANSQFSTSVNAVIHVGLETHDGPEVERKRFEKITQNAAVFDKKDKNLKLVYCHFLQTYSFTDDIFVCDESVAYFRERNFHEIPLKNNFLLGLDNVVKKNSLHWENPHP